MCGTGLRGARSGNLLIDKSLLTVVRLIFNCRAIAHLASSSTESMNRFIEDATAHPPPFVSPVLNDDDGRATGFRLVSEAI